MTQNKSLLIFGNSHPELNSEIQNLTHTSKAHVSLTRFPNSEVKVYIEENVHAKVAFVIQTLSNPVHDNLIELCLTIDALRRSNALKIIAITPWLCYSPQDKVFRKGEPLSISVVAKLIESVGCDELWAFDLHSLKIMEFFQIPVKNLSSMPLFIDHFRKQNLENYLVASLDKGSRERASLFAEALNLKTISFDKFRDRATGEITFKAMQGNVQNKNVISFDDFVSTGSTRIKAADILKQQGALTYTDCITHIFPIVSTYRRLYESKIDEIMVTNTIPILEEYRFPRLHTFSIAPLIVSEIEKEIDSIF